ncbi:MAG: flavin reductase family protein [Calditrichaeota bacterium]|nr:flavin reductase family protein [Calditrichota bacterium]
MTQIYFDLEKSDRGFNYRFVQPPQITYLISTIDEFGNGNVTPVTLGTCVGVNSLAEPSGSNWYFAFSVGSRDVPDIPVRDAFRNLVKNPECVISYPGAELMEKIWAMGLPFPRGINELEIAELTPLASKKVKPTGIKECPINLEARVQKSIPVGDHYQLFVCQIVAATIDENLIQKDNRNPLHLGVLEIDPLFEVAIVPENGKPPRLYFGKIDRRNFIRTPDDIGSSKKWLGSFEEWIEDEAERGKINSEEKSEILGLYEKWKENPDPETNEIVRLKLIEFLKKIIWERR